MAIEKIKTISVIGAGVMGSQIAMVCALAGFNVFLQDIKEESLQKAEHNLRERMGRQIEKGKYTSEDISRTFNRMVFTTSLEEALRNTDFVIEAIVEDLNLKREVFSQLDKVAPKHAILTTNSSTIVSSKIASATNRPEKVCNMHFSNPALVMELIEVVVHEKTSKKTIETVMELSKRLKKVPILIKKEISGFVMNRILAAIMNEAISLYEKGIASFEDIDLACTKGLNHPMGPFQLIDLTGLDVHYNVRMIRYKESGDEFDKPSKIVEEKVKRGELGRKTGKGFYEYS